MDLDHTKTVYFPMLDCRIKHSWIGTHPSNARHMIEYRSNDEKYATVIHSKKDFYKKWLF